MHRNEDRDNNKKTVKNAAGNCHPFDDLPSFFSGSRHPAIPFYQCGTDPEGGLVCKDLRRIILLYQRLRNVRCLIQSQGRGTTGFMQTISKRGETPGQTVLEILVHCGTGCAALCLFVSRTSTWKECLENAFLIHLSLSGSWWFMREYLIFLLLAPILDMLLDGIWENHGKRRWVYSTVVLLCMGTLAVLKLFVPVMDSFFDLIQPAFIAAFIVGFLLKKCGAYEFVERKLPENRMLQTALGIVLTVVVIASRVTLATDVSWAKFDFILAPIFALGTILMFRYTRGIAGLLETLGKHSVYM